ncbi:hybrid sensor histidine kinase/response regulator [Dysgonomonas sp. 520]|nr:hybrid sensor histidine kinase/response regulator [Dysgonomonas sp. 520]
MKKSTSIIILCLLPLILLAQPSYNFSNLSQQDGLSQITVTSIFQDSKGYMWFGTRNGLNKYNGYTFEVFVIDPENESSISDNHILCMTEDNSGNLWIGTNNGLNRLDVSTGKFERFFLNSDNENSLTSNLVSSIYFDSKSNILWIGTNNGLNTYNTQNKTISRIKDEIFTNNSINAITGRNEKLYFGTFNRGTVVYDEKEKTFDILANTATLHHSHVRAIFVDDKETIWIGTQNDGVKILKKDEKNFETYNNDNGLNNNYVRSIVESPDGNILIGTFNGLNLVDTGSGEISQYKTFNPSYGSLSHYSISSIYYDRSQTLWVGTYAGGVNYYNPFGQKFRFYDPGSEQKDLMGIIGPMVEIGKYLYIATEGGGLLEMNLETEKFSHYKLYNTQENSYARNILKSLYWDGKKILCGTNVGTIYSFDPTSKKFSLFHDFGSENGIYYINENKNGELIIGGVNQIGLVFISKDGHVKNKFPLKGNKETDFQNIRYVCEIEKDVYLIGTRNDGLYYYNLSNQELEKYRHTHSENANKEIPENYISYIYKDSMGQIWIGTFGGGLCLLDMRTKTFTTYNSKNGLLDNNVCAIVEDNNRHLWISTISGITDYDLDLKTFKSYTHSSGIKINEFTPHAGLRLSNNLIVFSGNNGFMTFNPRIMSVNPFIPPVILENLYVNNQKIVPSDDKNSILSNQLNEQKEITLKYNETNISIEFSALNYIFSNKNQYSYKLEGFDEDWNDVGTRRIAYYTNIPAGKYKFMVRASNNDGLWNDEGASIIITVLPPFWKTWWAYCLYALAFLGIVGFVLRYFYEKKRLENDIKLKQAEAKAQEEFHRERNKLFTNFSHELRTPLTLVISPLEDMVRNDEEFTPKVKENHRLMYSNSQRMLRIVNNLMDFQKKESGTMKLKISRGNFVDFTEEMVVFFKELAASRQIDFTFNHSENAIEYWFDMNLMEKVYFNFLSNAFKNVPNKGKVSVQLKTSTLSELRAEIPERSKAFDNEDIKYISLKIEDSGTGIAESELERIFQPFYQVAQNEHSSSGTGLGLSLSKSIIEMHHGIIWAESELGKGSSFICVLPIDKNLFDRDDIMESENIELTPYEIEIRKNDGNEKKSDKKKTHNILVVEDNADVRNYIISHLEEDYNIIKASNGSEAIDKAINSMPDLIISDVMMPKMDGMEMATILKKDLRTGHIPIIMITAKSMPEDMKLGYETGADDYITKPFNSSVLIARVKNIIQSREKLKDIYGKRFSLETLGVETTSADDKFLQKLYKAIENNVSNPELNLDSFSKEIGMSKANLYRKIKALTNLSPNEFIRNFRLEMAAKILKETKLPVSEVYVAVGFNSHAYFSNCFKALYGISPTEYANQMKQ